MRCCVERWAEDGILSPRHHMTKDLDTGELIQDCRWSDDETGRYCVHVRDEDGEIVREWVNPAFRHLPIEKWKSRENKKRGGLQPKTEIKTGNIKIVRVEWNEETKTHDIV